MHDSSPRNLYTQCYLSTLVGEMINLFLRKYCYYAPSGYFFLLRMLAFKEKLRETELQFPLAPGCFYAVVTTHMTKRHSPSQLLLGSSEPPDMVVLVSSVLSSKQPTCLQTSFQVFGFLSFPYFLDVFI